MSVNRNRLDNWFWCARFVKSKTLAGKLCRSGTVRVNGNLTKKAHFNIKVGDVVTFPLGIQIRVVRVVRIINRRGPYKEARETYADLTPYPKTEFSNSVRDRLPVIEPIRGSGRPTKYKRRQFDRFKAKM